MKEMVFPPHITELIRSFYKDQEATVRTENGECNWFTIGQGVLQGCILLPYLFNIYAEYIMRQVSIGECIVTNLRYADDTTLSARSIAGLQDLILCVKTGEKLSAKSMGSISM